METTKLQLLNHLIAGFKQFGTEKTARIISDAIDKAGPVENNHINWMHKETARVLNELSEISLTERGL